MTSSSKFLESTFNVKTHRKNLSQKQEEKILLRKKIVTTNCSRELKMELGHSEDFVYKLASVPMIYLDIDLTLSR